MEHSYNNNKKKQTKVKTAIFECDNKLNPLSNAIFHRPSLSSEQGCSSEEDLFKFITVLCL